MSLPHLIDMQLLRVTVYIFEYTLHVRGGKLDPQFMLPGKATPLSLQSADQTKQRDIIPGFIKAKETVVPKLYPPPQIPASYQPVHHSAPAATGTFNVLNVFGLM